MANLATLEIQAPQRLKMSYEEYLEFATDSQIVEGGSRCSIRNWP